MKTINSKNGFCKMYWDLFNDEELSISEVVAMSYIIDKYDIFRERRIIDGKEYVRVAETFVQARLSASIPTISKWLHHLADLGYFEIYQKTPKSPVWIHVRSDLINKDLSEDKSEHLSDDKSQHKSFFNQIINNNQELKNKTQDTTTIVAEVDVPEDKNSELQKLSDKFDSVLYGHSLFRKDNIYIYASPLWQREYTTEDMLKVIDWCSKNWSIEAKKNISPKSCFKAENFDNYLGKANSNIFDPKNPSAQKQEAPKLRKII